MVIEDLMRSPGSWLSSDREDGVSISSRVRLARNIAGVAFPGWAGEEERVRLCRDLWAAAQRTSALAGATFFDMGAIAEVDREVLQERHLISFDLAEKGSGSGLVVSADERIAVMINEEDHLRLQAMRPGLRLREVWEALDAVDSDLERQVEYAFSPQLGYLTACPSNVGTGLRASVMLHLSGLRLAGECDAVLNGLGKLGLAVRGIFGEGTEAYGNMFQVSNQATLGEPEATIIDRLVRIARELAHHEANARERLMEKRLPYVLDHVGRSLGVLTHAALLSSQESIDLLSALRLGAELGLIDGPSVAALNEVMLLIQPGHMQKMARRLLAPEERDQLRAQTVRERLKGVVLKG